MYSEIPEPIDSYFLSLGEPQKGCLLFLREFILAASANITERRSFNTPFYYYNAKWLGFISYDPKTKIIYIAFAKGYLMDHSGLVSEGRKKQKIFYVDPAKDIDVKSLKEILEQACRVS